MEEKNIDVWSYVMQLVDKACADATEALLVGAVVLTFLGTLGIFKGVITTAYILLRVFFTIFLASFIIRNANNVDNVKTKKITYVAAFAEVVSSVVIIVLKFF